MGTKTKREQKFYSSCSTTAKRRRDFYKGRRTKTEPSERDAGFKPDRQKSANRGFLT